MADSIASILDYIHPTASGVGIITTDKVWVVFDREIDETTIAAGNFFVTGPDFDTWSGPDLQLFLDRESIGTEDEILQSPGFHGFLQGEISFSRVSLTTLDEVTTEDTVGSGFLYRTKATFTPTNRLQANTEYTTYLSGDEDNNDTLQTGLSSRTVFDAVASGTNTGTGNVSFTGGYIGVAAQDTYRVSITTAGEVGVARFEFVRDSDALSVYGPFKTKRSGVLLSDGVTVEFKEGEYEVGDQWSVVVKERDIFIGNVSWPFKTGTGSIETIPTTTATSVIGDPAPTISTSSSSTGLSLSVTATVPADETSHLTIAPGDFDITVTFDKTIDQNSLVSGVSAKVYAESVTGETHIPASGNLTTALSVSNKQLTITVASGQLFKNNLVTVTLDSTIAATDGSLLGTDYEFWFTTTYSPMYCTLRLVNVRVGAFIDDLKDDTVNMAIHVASTEADMLTWNKANLDDDYYQFVRGQWACCRAAHILLTNTIGGAGAIKSKRLGDLQVEYNTSVDVSKPLQLAEECLLKWEGAVMAGGRQVQKPQMVVKGELDPDRPTVGRGWLHSRDINNGQVPAANRRLKFLGSRRFRNLYTRASFPKGWWNK